MNSLRQGNRHTYREGAVSQKSNIFVRPLLCDMYSDFLNEAILSVSNHQFSAKGYTNIQYPLLSFEPIGSRLLDPSCQEAENRPNIYVYYLFEGCYCYRIITHWCAFLLYVNDFVCRCT